MKSDKIICNCMNVTDSMIKEAVNAGANTLEEVQSATGAGNVCGVCLDEVERYVEAFIKERDN